MYTIEQMKEKLLKSNFDDFKKALDNYDIQQRDQFGNTILHYYSGHVNDLSLNFKDVYNEVLARGIDIDDKQSKGIFRRSFLHMAVIQNDIELFDYLLTKNPDVNTVDANGNSVLGTAVFNYTKDESAFSHYIEELLKRDADPDLENNHCVSAKALAERIANSDVRKFFKDL